MRNNRAVGKVGNSITIDECQKFHPEQWVKLYGVFSNRCDYIITCQVYHLETVVAGSQRHWWDDLLLEPVDEEEQPIPVEEALLKGQLQGYYPLAQIISVASP